MKTYSQIYPEVSDHYGIHPYAEKAWSLIFQNHLLIFDSPCNNALRNWQDAVQFAGGNGPHWTAIKDKSLGDKEVSAPARHLKKRLSEDDKETTNETRRALWDLPCVDYAGVFAYGTETELLEIAFTPASLATAEIGLWKTFDGWRYDYQINCHRMVGKKDHYHIDCYAVSIDQLPYPSRTAALEHFVNRTRCFLLESNPKESNPETCSAIAQFIEVAQAGIETGEGWRRYNPETREEIPNSSMQFLK